MSSILLSTPLPTPPPPTGSGPPPVVEARVRRMTLVSADGLSELPLDGSDGWWRGVGATGLAMTPVEVVTESAPGVDGSILMSARPVERPVFIPLVHVSGSGPVAHHVMLERLRQIVDPLFGEFTVVCASELGERELRVVYREGLEGSEGRSEQGAYWRKMGVSALAVDPHPRARADRSLAFTSGAGASGGVFLSRWSDPPGSAPWPRALSAGGVVGSDMRIVVQSQVPVWPTVDLTGPMGSFTGLMDTGWYVDVPTGVPAGSTLRIVTDPRSRSIRMDGELAAGRVARGSVLRPFRPGLNVLNVSAPGGGQGTRVSLSWRDGFRSLW